MPREWIDREELLKESFKTQPKSTPTAKNNYKEESK